MVPKEETKNIADSKSKSFLSSIHPFTRSPLHDAWIADADIAQRSLISRKAAAKWSCIEEHCIPSQHIAIIIHADHDTTICRLPVSTHICPIRLIHSQMGQGVIVRPISAVSLVWRTRVRRCVGDRSTQKRSGAVQDTQCYATATGIAWNPT